METSFRRWCENEAVKWRRKLNLYAYAPLPATKLAALLAVSLIGPNEIPDFDTNQIMSLLKMDSSGWSAVTITVPGQKPLIIYNPLHAPTRHEANIMHELAHLILDHKPIVIQAKLPFLRQSYRSDDEEEAKYLGGCLQVTRIGLDWAIGRNMSRQQISDHFGASPEMVQYRLNLTGRHHALAD
jgi:hypothetical protein